MQETLIRNAEFNDAVLECKPPYIKFSESKCCLDKDGDKSCDLEFDLTLKYATAKHLEGQWKYRLDTLIVDYSTKKNVEYQVVFEAYDKNNQVVSSEKKDIFLDSGVATNWNIIEGAIIEFQEPGVYTIKLTFFDTKDQRKPIESKSIKVLVGVTKENPTGPNYNFNIINFKATQSACYWIYPIYTLARENKSDTDFIYTIKKTYTIDGVTINEHIPSEVLPDILKAVTSDKRDEADQSEPTEQCYTGKNLVLKMEFLDKKGRIAFSKEYSAVIIEEQ